jgi:hypothetical protein
MCRVWTEYGTGREANRGDPASSTAREPGKLIRQEPARRTTREPSRLREHEAVDWSWLTRATLRDLARIAAVARRAARRVSQNSYVIDEAAEMTLLALVEYLRRGHRVENLKAWCSDVARKAAVRLAHQRHRQMPLEQFDPIDARPMTPAEDEVWIGDRLGWNVSRADADSFLDELSRDVAPSMAISLDVVRRSCSWVMVSERLGRRERDARRTVDRLGNAGRMFLAKRGSGTVV